MNKINIKDIPFEDLFKDLKETYEDINLCSAAIRIGILTYSGGRVQERLDSNRRIRRNIELELARRGVGNILN